MPIRLVVNYENPTHRFLKTAKVTLTLTGPPEEEVKGSKQGHHVWDIDDTVGQTYHLKILIPEPAGSGLGHALLDLNQLLQVIALPKGGASLTPKSPSSDPWKDHFNPRFSGQLVSAGKGPRFEINVDLTFLDVTEYYQKLTKRLDEYTSMPLINPVIQGIGLRPPDPPPHYDARLRILEFTGGRPVCWAVVIPPAVKADSNRIHATLFFRPALPKTYTNTDDLEIREMIRYIGDPSPEDFPYFSQPTSWISFPQCGWEKQISQANKCALFVHPFPHGGDFGVAGSAVFPDLLASVCKILWADKTIATNVFEGLRLGRIAASAFSFGGGALYQALTAKPDKIDDMYLFDPNATATNQAAIQAWFGRGGKKLRMFAGRPQHDAMIAIAKALASADATVNPPSRRGFEGPFTVYPFAIVCTPLRRTLFLSSITDPSPSKLSVDSGIFNGGRTADGGLKIEGRSKSGKIVSGVIPNCIGEEAAVAIEAHLKSIRVGTKLTKPKKLPNGKTVPAGTLEIHPPGGKDPIFIEPQQQLLVPMATDADVQQNVNVIGVSVRTIRHQWAVIGGDDAKLDTNRGINFRGYLRQALDAGSFT